MQFYKITCAKFLSPGTCVLFAKIAICRSSLYINNTMIHKCVKRKLFYCSLLNNKINFNTKTNIYKKILILDKSCTLDFKACCGIYFASCFKSFILLCNMGELILYTSDYDKIMGIMLNCLNLK